MRYLFVGGPHDGEWHEVPSDSGTDLQPREYFELAEAPPLPLVRLNEPVLSIPLRRFRYKRMPWRTAHDRTVWLFAPPGFEPDMVVRMLFRGYRAE